MSKNVRTFLVHDALGDGTVMLTDMAWKKKQTPHRPHNKIWGEPMESLLDVEIIKQEGH